MLLKPANKCSIDIKRLQKPALIDVCDEFAVYVKRLMTEHVIAFAYCQFPIAYCLLPICSA